MPTPIYSEAQLAPFLTAERGAETARELAYRNDMARSSGVCVSGMAPDRRTPRTEAQIMADAIERCDRHVAGRASPIGRFYRAIGDLREATFHAEAERLQGIYDRSLSNSSARLDVKAVAAALIILDGIHTGSAREASAALHELLLGAPPAMLIAAE